MENDPLASIRMMAEQTAKAHPRTRETKAAYAQGIRAMAAIVHACRLVADDMAERHVDSQAARTVMEGYSQALRRIVDAADDLIPPGYEL